MPLTVRSFLKLAVGLVASLAGRPLYAQQGQRGLLTSFIGHVRSVPSFRAKFAENPQQILRESGIDPSPYNLPDRLTDAQVDAFLEDLSKVVAAMPPPPPPREEGLRAPVAVYGPPPGPRRP